MGTKLLTRSVEERKWGGRDTV